MTSNELIAEGQRLARPCVHLRVDGEPANLAAIWGGPGQVPAPTPPPPEPTPPGRRNRRPHVPEYRHWLTIDCRFLPPNVGPQSGILSIYTASWDLSGVAVHDPLASLDPSGEGRRLYAHPAMSLPPLEALLLYGSPEVREWFGEMGWDADLDMNGPLLDEEIQNAYVQAERENTLFDGEHVFAVLGGWHTPWPDGDWLELVDRALVVFTLVESEPWVEVFNMGESFQVIQRVS